MANLTADRRTPLQREADSIDSDLYRVICRVEALYDRFKRCGGPRVTDLHKSLQGLRNARIGIRMLMNDDDRARTI